MQDTLSIFFSHRFHADYHTDFTQKNLRRICEKNLREICAKEKSPIQGMKNYVLLLFCSFIPFVINAQEGFWSIDQIPQVQEKLQAAGLAFPLEKLTNAKHDGLANAVIRFDYGNAVFLNAQGLAFGLLSPSVVPDSIWPLMEANHGVWLAQSGQEIPLKGFPAEVYVNSKPLKDQRLEPGQAFFFTSYETQPDGSSYAVETHLAGAQSTQVVEQRYKRYTALQLIGVIQLPVEGAREQQIGVLLRMHTSPEKAQNAETPAGTTPYIPLGKHEINQPNHVVLGHPRGSSIHRLGFELDVALELAKCHQDLDRALGAYVTRPPFITEDGVFRHYEDQQLLAQALPKRTIQEAEFRHQLSQRPELKARYGTLLDSCRLAFQDLKRYVPAQVYTKGIVYSPCSFFEAVRLFTMWRGRIGTSAHRLPSTEESQYFPEVFNRLPATENELLLPELLQRYYQNLPAAHLAPYAVRQAVYANKDYARLSETLLIKSKFGQPELISGWLNEDFLSNIDVLAIDPAVQLVDSMLQFFADKVVPAMGKARQKAYRKADELRAAMSEVLPNYPMYPDADHSLRLSYGTLLGESTESTPYLLSNAHVLDDQLGSPVLNQEGKLIGIVKGLTPTTANNAYFYDPESSRALVWTIESIRKRIQQHPFGADLLREWR